MSTSDDRPDRTGFRPDQVADYERRRYRGLDQRLVDARERRVLERIFARLRREGCLDGAAESSSAASTGQRRQPLVMDLPSGYGRMTDLIQRSGARPVNVDISLSMVARAMERARAQPPGEGDSRPAASPSVSPWGVVADATAGLPFRDGAFDAVLCLRLFHHFHDEAARRSALAEFRRVSSSAIVLSYYRATWLHRCQRRIRRLAGRGSYKIKMLAGSAFAREAAAAGLRVAASYPLWRGLHAQTIALIHPPSMSSEVSS